MVALLNNVAGAQTAQEIISKVDATQKATKDLTMRLTGMVSLDTASQKIDFLLKTIPAQNVARLQFYAPDAFADNIVIADKNEIRQYMYLTNQITVMSTKKASDSAGLGGIDFTQLANTSSMLNQYNVKLLSTSGSGSNRVFQLEAIAKNGGTDKIRMWISENGWRPTKVQMLNGTGKQMALLNIASYKVNSGLTLAGLKVLPKDAEIIRQ